jgi:hypothetical protein
VSQTLQDDLTDAGIAVLAKREGRNERLVGTTKAGKMFCLHLHSAPAVDSVQTVVTVEWGREPDERFWQTVTGLLEDMQEAEE